MIAVDTNILVRFLVRDDETQYQKVVHLFSDVALNNQKIYVPLLVVLETNWVLSFHYKIQRQDIIEQLLSLTEIVTFCFEYHHSVQITLKNALNNSFDLSDLLIACRCAVSQHLPVMTFDKKASKCEYFQLLT